MAALDDNQLDPDTEYSLLNGQDRAGLLLSSLGMNITQLIFQNMKDNDVKRMINAMSNVKKAPIWMVKRVLEDFYKQLNEENDLNGYNANIDGVKNLINILNEESLNVKKTIYTSSRMVCKIDYLPINYDDYCPPNLYGESKMIGEKLIKEKALHPYIIIRPTSIWGPWFDIPYRTFFDTIKKGSFFMPKYINPKKSFGFVLNSTYQIEKLLFSSEAINKTFYLSDYPHIELKTWANLIAKYFNVKNPKVLSLMFLKTIAFGGDLLKILGFKNPPLTTFRLNNIITDMVYDLSELESICGELPYSLEEGVKITTNWVKEH